MSKINLPIAELKPALAGLGKIIAKRSTLPVLSCVRIDRNQAGWVTITATDLDAFVTVRLEEPADGAQASILVPYEDLLKTSKGCSAGETIAVEQSSSKYVILHYPVGQQTTQIQIKSCEVEEFPPIPRIKGEPVSLNDEIRKSLQEAFECASTDETRYILQGAFIDLSDKKCQHIVATDGRHLYSSNSFALPLTESVIIPTNKFIGWKEFNNDGEWQLRLEPAQKKDEHGYLQISSRRWRFIHKQIEGNYPNWRQIVRNTDETRTTIELEASSTGSIIALVTRIPNHDKVNCTIGIEIKGRHVHLLGKSQASEPWTRFEIAPAKTTGRDVTVYLNRDYLAKALRFGLTRVEIIDDRSPLRFVSGGRQMIVMPIRPDAATPVPANPPQPPAANTNPPPQEAQQERNTTMRQPNGSATGTTTNGAQRSAQTTEDKSALETALAQVEIVRGDFRNAITGLNKLGEALKAAQREQKTADKEVQAARQTLEKLQSVRI